MATSRTFTALPSRMGRSDLPSTMCEGTGTPMVSRKVGSTSIASARAIDTWPWVWGALGSEMISGIRTPCSNMNSFSPSQWSPR